MRSLISVCFALLQSLSPSYYIRALLAQFLGSSAVSAPEGGASLWPGVLRYAGPFAFLPFVGIFPTQKTALITVQATSPPVYLSARRGGLRGAGGRSTDAKIAANRDCK